MNSALVSAQLEKKKEEVMWQIRLMPKYGKRNPLWKGWISNTLLTSKSTCSRYISFMSTISALSSSNCTKKRKRKKERLKHCNTEIRFHKHPTAPFSSSNKLEFLELHIDQAMTSLRAHNGLLRSYHWKCTSDGMCIKIQ